MSLIEKLKELIKNRRENTEQYAQPLDDWETRDKGLKALRRLKRMQLDQLEREQLNKSIQDHLIKRNREAFTSNSFLFSDKKKKFKQNKEMCFLK